MNPDYNLTPAQRLEKINKMWSELLKDRINELTKIYGSTRAVGRALNIDHAYLHRLMNGEKQNPSKTVMRKLGLG